MKQDKTTFLDIPVLSGGSHSTHDQPTEAGPDPQARVWPIESWLIRKFMHIAGEPSVRIVLWDGKEYYRGPHEEPVGAIRFAHRETLWRFFANPSLGFGDEFSNGLIEVDGDLVKVLEAIFRAHVLRTRPGRIQQFLGRGLVRQRRNSLDGSRKNIHHHYDLGNDFYELWLDEEMAYTCAYFPEQDISLEAAQFAKMDHVCRKLRLQPGESVIEAGCGWGGLARHMARHYGVKVKAYNISHQQILYARERAKAEGLDDRIEYIEDDYREITDRCDVFVSVGMLEHVGAENYAGLGQVIDRVLSENGRGLIHTIAKNRPEPTSAWTEKRLFPGGYTPTLREMMDIFEEPGFSVLDVENLRLHYAKTCEHWLERYERNIDPIKEHFDDFFVRAWRLYLAGCVAHFRAGSLQLFQVTFARATANDIPWTRAHLYEARDA
jgi:cyclopropane-fatty-acyl-phospholipid synthase